jgi:hypothetical protein
MPAQEGSSSPWSHSIRSFNDDSSSEDEMDWEEVNVGTVLMPVAGYDATAIPSSIEESRPSQSIEITLDTANQMRQEDK